MVRTRRHAARAATQKLPLNSCVWQPASGCGTTLTAAWRIRCSQGGRRMARRSSGTRDRRLHKVIHAVDLSASAGVTLAAVLITLGAASTACGHTVSGIAVVHSGGAGFAADDPSGNGGDDGNGGNGRGGAGGKGGAGGHGGIGGHGGAGGNGGASGPGGQPGQGGQGGAGGAPRRAWKTRPARRLRPAASRLGREHTRRAGRP